MTLKYLIQYKDVLGAQWDITIQDARPYSGQVIELLAAKTPCVITMDGAEDDILDPIRTGSAKIKVVLDSTSLSLLDDLETITDKTLLVTVTSSKSFIWTGWVIPDQIARTFTRVNQEVTINCKDNFSPIKSIPLTQEDGTKLYGKHGLMTIVDNAFRNWDIGVARSVSVVNDLTLDNAAPSLQGRNVFEQIAVAVETFNDDSGNPGNGFDIISRIMKSFVSFCFYYNNALRIINPVFLDLDNYRSVYIKSDEHQDNFLIGNDEQMTFLRGMKEVSAETTYKNQSGFLKNEAFSDWDEPPTIPDDWNHQAGGVIEKVGNGRPENPYAVRLSINANDEYARLTQTAFRKFKKGEKVKISVDFTYRDWIATLGDTDYVPIIPVCLILHGDNGVDYFSKSVAFSDDYKGETAGRQRDPEWVEVAGGNTPLDPNPLGPDNVHQEFFNGLAVNPDSKTGKQSFTVTMPSLPTTGNVVVTIQAALIYWFFVGQPVSIVGFENVTNDYQGSTPVIYSRVLLSTSNTGLSEQTGEKIYLTQNETFTGVLGPVDMEIDTSIPEDYAGATFSSYSFGSVTSGDHVSGLMTTDSTDKYPLSIWALINMMYYLRNIRGKIDLTYRSNEIFFTDLLKFEGVLPGIYLQLKSSYNTKTAEQTVSVAELKGLSKPWTDAGGPTETDDFLEIYPKFES